MSSVCKCLSTHHWQLVEVKQLFDKASEHVLTLPHLIQGPRSKECTKRGDTGEMRQKNRGVGDQCAVLVILVCLHLFFKGAFTACITKTKYSCVDGDLAGFTYLTAFVSRQAYR